jgi:transposase
MEERIKRMLPMLNEKQKRLFLASEALPFGRGGIAKVCKISGCSKNTVRSGIAEFNANNKQDDRIRKNGAGPKFKEEYFPDIQEKVRLIVEESTYGNPENILLWTTQSLRKIATILHSEYNINVSHTTVGDILETIGYSKQSNQKMLQVGEPNPDRNAQFEYINVTAKQFIAEGEPVISVDTKKKENLGNFKNGVEEYRAKKNPRKVLDHDFPFEELGKIAPYGVYNLNKNIGFVNVGRSHDTAEFAVKSILRWWEAVGKRTFPEATKLLITADCGGSNGYRVRLWKYQLQQFSHHTGLDIYVSHFPPGTSKWNKVEHKLFCFISKNWQGKPLIDVESAVKLIGSTTTKTGLEVICVSDDTKYELAVKVSDSEFKSILLDKIEPFGTWNYKIRHT